MRFLLSVSCLFPLQVDTQEAIKPCLLTSLFFLPFSLLVLPPMYVHCPPFLLSSLLCLICFCNISRDPLLCPLVADTALPSTSFSLCSRPTTGPPSVFVFPTFTLNSSCLSTTSWSGTVQHLIPLPQHIHLARPFPWNMLVFIYWHWYLVNWVGSMQSDCSFCFCLFFIFMMELLGGGYGVKS